MPLLRSAGRLSNVTTECLSVVIPAYNEERRIEPVLRSYAEYFRKNYSGKFQLVVVLNGCRDNTLGVVQKVAADFPAVSALEFKEAIGKVTGDAKLETEGEADKAAGKVQDAIGSVKDAVRDALNK